MINISASQLIEYLIINTQDFLECMKIKPYSYTLKNLAWEFVGNSMEQDAPVLIWIIYCKSVKIH